MIIYDYSHRKELARGNLRERLDYKLRTLPSCVKAVTVKLNCDRTLLAVFWDICVLRLRRPNHWRRINVPNGMNLKILSLGQETLSVRRSLASTGILEWHSYFKSADMQPTASSAVTRRLRRRVALEANPLHPWCYPSKNPETQEEEEIWWMAANEQRNAATTARIEAEERAMLEEHYPEFTPGTPHPRGPNPNPVIRMDDESV